MTSYTRRTTGDVPPALVVSPLGGSDAVGGG